MTDASGLFARSPLGLKKNHRSGRVLFDNVMTVLAGLCLTFALIPLFAVLFYTMARGAGRFNWALFTELPPGSGLEGGGLGNAIVGTIMVILVGLVISIPFGVLGAVYLSEFSSGKIAQGIRFATNVLSGVPSIIAGVFAYGILVVTTGQFSAIAGGTALAVLMIPTVVRTTDESLKIVPQDIRWASVGLGASNYQTVLQVVLPAALPAIITGVMLAVARAAGETAPLIFTALNSPFWPKGFAHPTPTLAVTVFNFAIVPFESQQELAWAGSLLLVLMVLVTSILARWATSRKVG